MLHSSLAIEQTTRENTKGKPSRLKGRLRSIHLAMISCLVERSWPCSRSETDSHSSPASEEPYLSEHQQNPPAFGPLTVLVQARMIKSRSLVATSLDLVG